MAIPTYTDISTASKSAPGEVSTNYKNNYVESEVCGSNALKFGYGIQVKSGVANVLAAADAATISARNTFGIAVFSPVARGLDDRQYEQYDQVGILKTGIINVICEETVAKGDAVRVRLTNHASDATKLVGKFGTTADTAKTAVINGARFVRSSGSLTVDGSTYIIAELFLPDSITLTVD